MSWTRESVYLMIAVLGGLLGFGIWYDRLAGRLERHDQAAGYRAILTLGGVTATGMGFVVVVRSVELGVVLMACFCASGLPMIVGEMRRAMDRRREEELELARAAREAMDVER